MAEQIFISYSRKDINYAQYIVSALAENNLDTWIDWESIPIGEEWEQEIYRGIEETEVFLFLVSPDSVQSVWCNKEIIHAVENGKRILPIIIRDTQEDLLPTDISKREWIHCREKLDDFGKAIHTIQDTIHTDYGWVKYHTQLLTKALAWEREPDTSRLLRGKELKEAEERLVIAGDQTDPKVTILQRNFVFTSTRNAQRVRNLVILISVIAGVIMLVLGFYGQLQGNLATDRAATAQAASTGEAQQALTAQIARTL